MKRHSWMGLVIGVLAVVAMAVPAHAVTVLFIGDRDDDGGGDGNDPLNRAADDAMIARLEGFGNIVLDRDESTATPTDLAQAGFVMISATASSGSHNGNLSVNPVTILGTEKPVILMEAGLADEYGLNGGSSIGGAGSLSSITLHNLESPLTDGLGGPGAVQIFNSPQAITAFGAVGAPAPFEAFNVTGTPLAYDDGGTWGLGGFNLASFTSTMNGNSHIVGLPFNLASFTDANANGERLFDNAVVGAGGLIPEPSIVLMSALGTLVLLRRRLRRG